MKLKSIKRDLSFIPEFNDNKTLPASEQIKVFFEKLPPASQRNNYVTWACDARGKMELIYKDSELLAMFVKRIDNLSDEKSDGTVEMIRNGADLAESSNPQLGDLIAEIRNYCYPPKNEADDTEKKSIEV